MDCREIGAYQQPRSHGAEWGERMGVCLHDDNTGTKTVAFSCQMQRNSQITTIIIDIFHWLHTAPSPDCIPTHILLYCGKYTFSLSRNSAPFWKLAFTWDFRHWRCKHVADSWLRLGACNSWMNLDYTNFHNAMHVTPTMPATL